MTQPSPPVTVDYVGVDGANHEFTGNTLSISILNTGVMYQDPTGMQYFVPYSHIIQIRCQAGVFNWS